MELTRLNEQPAQPGFQRLHGDGSEAEPEGKAPRSSDGEPEDSAPSCAQPENLSWNLTLRQEIKFQALDLFHFPCALKYVA